MTIEKMGLKANGIKSKEEIIYFAISTEAVNIQYNSQTYLGLCLWLKN